jgi:hypothetical protein
MKSTSVRMPWSQSGLRKDIKMAGHRWSGWPGAYCLDCGAEDPIEVCIADGCYVDDEDGMPLHPCMKHSEASDCPGCVKCRQSGFRPWHRDCDVCGRSR